MASLSYYHKPRTNPLDIRTLHQIYDDNTAKHPDKESIVFYDANQHRSSLTFQQLKNNSIKVAASLLTLGFKRGDRILLYSATCLEYVVSWMAVSRVGACAVMMCPIDGSWQEVVRRYKKLRCVGLICGFSHGSVPNNEQRKITLKDLIEMTHHKNIQGGSLAKGIITIGEKDTDNMHPYIFKYENIIKKEINEAEVVINGYKVDAEDPAFTIFTSGSTGQSKAVVYTHHAIISAVNLSLSGMRLDGDRRSFTERPISRGNGGPPIAMALVIGHTCILTQHTNMSMRDSYKFKFDIVTTENCSGCSIPQEHVHHLIADKFYEKHDFSKIPSWGFGNQIVPRKTIKALLSVFPEKRAMLVYAMTEVFTIAIQPLSQSTIANKKDYGKVYIFPDIEVKIIDDQGHVVPLETRGEICVRGPKMFLEYLEDPEATTKVKTCTGWVHTGDCGIMYDQARLKVLGRKSDVIVTSQHSVFPVEVEEILLESPYVQDTVAVGIPNKDNKEDICACIIEVPGSNLEGRLDELEEWCEKAFGEDDENNYAAIPRPDHFMFMNTFPISECGKIDRQEIKNIAKQTVIAL